MLDLNFVDYILVMQIFNFLPKYGFLLGKLESNTCDSV